MTGIALISDDRWPGWLGLGTEPAARGGVAGSDGGGGALTATRVLRAARAAAMARAGTPANGG